MMRLRLAWGAGVMLVVVVGTVAFTVWGKPQRDPKQVAVAGPLNGFVGNVNARAEENTDYRRVIFTGQKTQLVLMSLPPAGDIGEESHARVEQLFFCVAGTGQAMMNGKRTSFKPGDAFVSTPGTRHNVKNTGTVPLKLYTIYSPPNHLDRRVQPTKADAQADRADQEFSRRVEQGTEGGNGR